MNEYPEKTNTGNPIYVKITPACAFGIVVAFVAGICFCVYTGMEHGYEVNFGSFSLTAKKTPELIAG